MFLAVVAIAQLADLVTWLPAIVKYPDGEGGVARFSTVENMVIAKALGIAIVVTILVVVTRLPNLSVAQRRSWSRRGAFIVGLAGVLGMATNVINGGLL